MYLILCIDYLENCIYYDNKAKFLMKLDKNMEVIQMNHVKKLIKLLFLVILTSCSSESYRTQNIIKTTNIKLMKPTPKESFRFFNFYINNNEKIFLIKW